MIMDDIGNSSDSAGALAHIRRLYNHTNGNEILFPTCWNQKDKHNYISLSGDNLVVQYKGEECVNYDHCTHKLRLSVMCYWF